MARRSAVAGRHRGGEGIPPARSAGARLTTALGSIAAPAAVAAYAAASRGPLAIAGGAIAAAGAVVLAAAVLLRLPTLVSWSVALTGAGYVVARAHRNVLDGWSPVVGASLLLAAEVAAWSIADDRRIREERPLVVRQALVVAALVAAAALVDFVLVGAAAASVSAGLVLTAAGVAAAVAAVAVVLRLVR